MWTQQPGSDLNVLASEAGGPAASGMGGMPWGGLLSMLGGMGRGQQQPQQMGGGLLGGMGMGGGMDPRKRMALMQALQGQGQMMGLLGGMRGQ